MKIAESNEITVTSGKRILSNKDCAPPTKYSESSLLAFGNPQDINSNTYVDVIHWQKLA